MKEIICVVCPKGCHLLVDEENDYKVTGHSCEKGLEYGKKELVNPTRVLTSTVVIKGGLHKRLPVKTSADIPKTAIFDCMQILDHVVVKSPVKVNDVIIKNVMNLGIDIVATRDM